MVTTKRNRSFFRKISFYKFLCAQPWFDVTVFLQVFAPLPHLWKKNSESGFFYSIFLFACLKRWRARIWFEYLGKVCSNCFGVYCIHITQSSNYFSRMLSRPYLPTCVVKCIAANVSKLAAPFLAPFQAHFTHFYAFLLIFMHFLRICYAYWRTFLPFPLQQIYVRLCVCCPQSTNYFILLWNAKSR
jgi:hypothetical protein